jgi:hypothetical protein
MVMIAAGLAMMVLALAGLLMVIFFPADSDTENAEMPVAPQSRDGHARVLV